MCIAETKRIDKPRQQLPSSKMGSVNNSNMPRAACKLLRRRCSKECIFLPHFPPTEPQKFAAAHRIFGASNIGKLLQEIPVKNREDAVMSMVYEATARLRDPVYGCAGTVAALQKQVFCWQSHLNAVLSEAVALRKQLPDALPMLTNSQAYEFTSDMEDKGIDSFHFPQMVSQFNNDYEKDFDGMLQALQVLDSCQASGSE